MHIFSWNKFLNIDNMLHFSYKIKYLGFEASDHVSKLILCQEVPWSHIMWLVTTFSTIWASCNLSFFSSNYSSHCLEYHKKNVSCRREGTRHCEQFNHLWGMVIFFIWWILISLMFFLNFSFFLCAQTSLNSAFNIVLFLL